MSRSIAVPNAGAGPRVSLAAAVFLAVAAVTWLPRASAQAAERTGKDVVDAVCAACHASGLHGAPVIGDSQAWERRASLGLSILTRHAIEGVRQMPAHGGNPTLSDLEIGRAIAYMVNRSGGSWVEPASVQDLMTELSGEQVVAMQCAKCHESGANGAPRVGDRNAWIPRLTAGIDVAVRSAIRGHGGMPPRGGLASITDSELRNAVVYMYNPAVARATAARAAPGAAKPAAARTDPYHRTVGGTEIYLGFAPAERLRAFAKGTEERTMHGGVSRGADLYHVNVSLFDRGSKAPIEDARVEVRVDEPGLTSESKTLEPMTVGTPSYGNYFTLRRDRHYVITVRVQSPALSQAAEARFEHDPR